MEDMERYGDYNEVDAPPSKGRRLLILKIVVAVICFSVIAVLILRIITFNSYPDFSKTLFYDDVLTAHYNEKGGNIEVITQNIRAEYDDPDEGNIFCNHLLVIKDASQLQVALKFNKSVAETLKTRFGKSFDVMSGNVFTFRLVRDNPEGKSADTFDERCVLGTLSVKKFDTAMQYGYYKLVFNGVDFSGEVFGGIAPSWIRLETFIDDGSGNFSSENVFTYNCIYEDNDKYNVFETYELSEKEVPRG